MDTNTWLRYEPDLIITSAGQLRRIERALELKEEAPEPRAAPPQGNRAQRRAERFGHRQRPYRGR